MGMNSPTFVQEKEIGRILARLASGERSIRNAAIEIQDQIELIKDISRKEGRKNGILEAAQVLERRQDDNRLGGSLNAAATLRELVVNALTSENKSKA
jgi:hypothetical protein